MEGKIIDMQGLGNFFGAVCLKVNLALPPLVTGVPRECAAVCGKPRPSVAEAWPRAGLAMLPPSQSVRDWIENYGTPGLAERSREARVQGGQVYRRWKRGRQNQGPAPNV